MKKPEDEFTQTPFYRERESAILRLLERTTLPESPVTGKNEPFDLSDAVYYTGCVAGSLGLPVDSDNIGRQLALLRANAREGTWPEIAGLLREIYARANEEAIAVIRADPELSSQPWALVRGGQSCPPPDAFEHSAAHWQGKSSEAPAATPDRDH